MFTAKQQMSTSRRSLSERCRILPISLVVVLIAVSFTASVTPSHAVVTPFGQRVNEAINRGLDWLRANQENNGGWGRPTGLALLCFLEQRAGADWNAPALGYVGMDPADQDRVERGVRYCINDINSFSPGGQAQSYDAGACMMAMSLYLTSGGPPNVGAEQSVDQAINNGIDNLNRNQGGNGGFSYGNSNSIDMSTHQFAMMGLFAASRLNPAALNRLGQAANYSRETQNNDGGHGYQPGRSSTSPMTASGVWTYKLSGRETEDGGLQQSLQWLQNNYRYQDHINSKQ